ncbi:MAG: N-acetylglucosamine-6-phosphate deacetylase, partial [Deinococcus sp.]
DLVAEGRETGVVWAVTVAPDWPGETEAGLSFARAGMPDAHAHARADAETVTAFLNAVSAAGGRTSATHLYNAIGGIEGRVPGPPGALLADPQAFAEVISGGIHVHETSFRLTRAAAPGRVLLITDAMRGAGLGDGESELGG